MPRLAAPADVSPNARFKSRLRLLACAVRPKACVPTRLALSACPDNANHAALSLTERDVARASARSSPVNSTPKAPAPAEVAKRADSWCPPITSKSTASCRLLLPSRTVRFRWDCSTLMAPLAEKNSPTAIVAVPSTRSISANEPFMVKGTLVLAPDLTW